MQKSFNEYVPGYDLYRQILSDIKKSGKLMDYSDAREVNEFVILRHDVEFSMERAYKMAQIENEEQVSSTYFVQISNNAYNAFSDRNKKRIAEIKDMGHVIGLHYHLEGETDPLKVRDGIRDQLRIMSELLGFPVERFSIHRPIRQVYYNMIPIEGVINAYSSEYFTLLDADSDGNIDETKLEVKYIADSRHQWNYGYPDQETLKKYKKIQLLIHPDFWSEEGLDAEHNFRKMIRENSYEFINTLNSECHHFSQYKEKIEKEI